MIMADTCSEKTTVQGIVVARILNLKPIEPVAVGDTYEFQYHVDTRAGHTHPKGSLLHVEDFTLATPHLEISESGRNWVCRTDFGTSVWATLEQCISRGLFKKVPRAPKQEEVPSSAR